MAVGAGALLLPAPALAAKGVVSGLGAASSGVTGGLFGSPHGLAVNTSGNGGVAPGTLYVADSGNNRIQSFSPAGVFLGAWGAGVISGGAEGIGNVIGGSTKVESVSTVGRAFAVGQTLAGEGIPSGTTIAAIGTGGELGTITLSQPATETKPTDVLTVAEGAGNVPQNERQTVTLAANTNGGTFPLTFTAPNPQSVANPQTTAAIAWNATATGPGSVQAALEALSNIGPGNVAVSGPAGGPWAVEFEGARFADTNLAQMVTNATRLTVSSGAKSATVATAVEGAAAYELCTTASSCTAGTASAAAGGLSSPQGIAVEQSTGNLYVTDPGNARVDVYSATGAFQGAFGWKVNATTPEEKLQLCTAATGCRAGSAGAGAGQLGASLGYPALSPLNGHLLLADQANRRVDEFLPTISAGEVTAVSFLRGYGWGAETGAAEFQICTATCHAPAATGGGAGQFATNGPSQLGVDSAGNVYALDSGNNRVQVFGPSGAPTESAFAAAQLGSAPAPADLYVDPAAGGHVFVDKSNGTEVRVLEFSPAGALLETDAAGAGLTSSAGLAYDSTTGNVYVATGQRVLVLNTPLVPPTAMIEPVTAFSAHTAQLTGTVDPNGFETGYHFEYSSDGGLTWTKLPAADVNIGAGSAPVPVSQEATGLTANATYQVKLVATKPFAAAAATAGPLSFATAVAPTIDSTYATSVSAEEAQLGAEIDPNGLATAYQLEYVDAAHYHPAEPNPYAEGEALPASPAAIGAGTTDATVSQRLQGLAPATTYHYRALATNSIGPAAGPDHAFTTTAVSGPAAGCPNEALRTGPSAALPDCRAYEMVSPVDKNGGNVDRLGEGPGVAAGAVEQVAADGDSATYTSLAGFEEPQGAPIGNQYLATRAPGGGWSTQNISQPSYSGTYVPISAGSVYKAFAADLSRGLLFGGYHGTNPLPLPGSGAPPGGYENYYLRDSAGGALQALLTATPPQPASEFSIEFHGATADLGHIVVNSFAQGPAMPAGLYEYSSAGGEYQPINVLPGQTLPEGGVGGTGGGRLAATIVAMHPISEDGSRVFWTGPGGLYLRQGIGGPDPQTVQLDASEGPGPGGAGEFWAASADGSLAFFTADASAGLTADTLPGSGQNLYRYDLEAPAGHHLTDLTAATTAAVQGVVGASEDGSYLYFVAAGVLSGAEENGEGAKAQPGQPNLYLSHAGATTFIATLASSDNNEGVYNDGFPSDWTPSGGDAYGHTARVSPDGAHLVFTTTRSLTGYDNAGPHCVPVDHRPEPLTYAPGSCAEVYLYAATANRLDCVSCNPTGERPLGPSTIPAATRYTEGEGATYLSRVLSTDGNRVFFESLDALLPGDSNAKEDVYEWEAPGAGLSGGGCSEAGAAFSPAAAGCLALISDGAAGAESYFLDASADGADVFFTTRASLVPKDPGLVDLYDAREGGGEPPAAPPPGSCEGDACQSPPPAPNDPTPASSTYAGPGNVHEEAPKPKPCPKGKVRKAGKCVSKHHKTKKHSKRSANTNRGGAK